MFGGLILLRRGFGVASWILVIIGFVLAGAISSDLFEFRYPPSHVSHLDEFGIDLGDPVRIEGRLVSSPLWTPSGLQFDLEAEAIEFRGQLHALSGKIRLRLQNAQDPESAASAGALRLRYGDSIRTFARLERPRVYRNPGSFDFSRWLQSIEDVHWLGTIKSPFLIERLPGRNQGDPAILFVWVRQKLLTGIDRIYPPWSVQGRVGAVLKAVLLGDRSSLDSGTVENFRKTGLYHLLVIAGLHIGLLTALAARLLRVFPLSESWRQGLVVLGLLAYSGLVEQRAPTIRATLMIIAFLVARFLYREHGWLNALGLAGLVLLLRRPPWLFESGFQFSFAAALLIVGWIGPLLNRTTEPYRKALRNLKEVGIDQNFEPRLAQFRLDVRGIVSRLEHDLRFFRSHPALAFAAVTGPLTGLVWILDLLIFTAALQMGLLLPMTEIFHRVTLAGIAMNSLAIPIMTLILGLGVPTVVLASFAPAWAAWPGQALAWIMKALLFLTDLPHLPAWLTYRIPEPPAWAAWGFALAIMATAWTFGRHARAFWISSATFGLIALLVSLHPFPPRVPNGFLEITALDCGAGGAFFIVLPDRTTLLFDAGGRSSGFEFRGENRARSWDPGESIVSPYLWSRGIKSLDVLVLGESQRGHLEGMNSVLNNFGVSEFWYGQGLSTPEGLALVDAAERRGVRLRAVASGDRMAYGTTSLEILWPPAAGPDRMSAMRALRSEPIALRISADEVTALVTDDPIATAEPASLHTKELWACRLVAAGGAKASLDSGLLRRVSPRLAVVSIPEETKSETLRLWKTGGTKVFRTDTDGAVTVEMRGDSMLVRTYGHPSPR